MGLKRRRIAHTQLNTVSSRSHSVLSVRLIQFQNDILPTSLAKDDLTLSTIHSVDLAGSERVNRAKTVGERVKEAGNINSSLMVLRQCFETSRKSITSNQQDGSISGIEVDIALRKVTLMVKVILELPFVSIHLWIDMNKIQHQVKYGESVPHSNFFVAII
ncbi:unnamed protein product [Adineta ricciae]|uniref:Kinesin motor domain-containing protein n=1 Tax=Adineta ricciae TaxID=249248 RepID=A0A815A045_ADIRI|nr:unnamed protein product [Adineta ricciae]CAF1472140.1 unnamed protein product [Adineta ricciae]